MCAERPEGGFKSTDPNAHFVVRRSGVLHDFKFPEFAESRKSVIIWGGGLSHETYKISGKTIDEIVEEVFGQPKRPLTIYLLDSEPVSSFPIEHFSWPNISRICSPHATEEMIIADTAGDVIWFFSESMEYSILSFLNASVAGALCPVPIDEIQLAFHEDADQFRSSAKDAKRIAHFERELSL